MCVSNTATCTTWTAFAATKSWTLTSGNGTKTVNVWYQDVWDNVSAPYSDTIILDTIAPTNGTLTAVPGDTEVMLSWTGFEDTGSGIGSYKVVFAKGAVPLSCSTGTALDPIATAKIEELIYPLRGQYTIIIVTHNMQQAVRVSDNTAFMYLGKLIEYGETTTIFTNPRVRKTEDYVTGRFG